MSGETQQLAEAIARLREWAQITEDAYNDGGFAAGDGPIPPDVDDVFEVCEAAEANECPHPSLDGTELGDDVWLCMTCGRLVERVVSPGSLATVSYRLLDVSELKRLLG